MVSNKELREASVVHLRELLASGELSAVDLAKVFIDRIEEREAEIQAWVWFDAEAALEQARQLDDLRASGAPLGPLHGLPVGIKDIIDTAGIPTENGCPLDAGRVPETDAAVVQRLKQAGAVMFGKTVTTELAFLHPNKTRNPHNVDHTPGGSSSGSAAAVADGMIPLAIGTQTGGSMIRPASFCGITGFKPSFDAISKKGVLMQSHSLDTVGTFARDPAGAALLARVLFSRPADGPENGSEQLSGTVQQQSGKGPVFGCVELPGWERSDPALQTAFNEFCAGLGESVITLSLPNLFANAAEMRAVINGAEMGYHFERYLKGGAAQLGLPTRTAIAEGLQLTATNYLAAKFIQEQMPAALAPLFAKCDVILCPAALGPAPETLNSTGDSIFNGLWTMAGTPVITLPLLKVPNGLPMGIQLVAATGNDDKLLSVANRLWASAKKPN